jgi:transcriptional regulator with PAS, ATPase and Fis domain
MVEAGTFREDLFYRLNVIPIRLPSLRERRADIPLLAQYFLDRLAKDSQPARGKVTLSQEAQQALMGFDWPGNVRHLENVIERAFSLSPGRSQIEAGDLPEEVRRAQTPRPADENELPEAGTDLDDEVSRYEHSRIRQALDRTKGNKRRAAELLGLKRTTLIEKLKRLERR